jgi:hypothetical protein
MTTDIKLNQDDGTFMFLEARVVKAVASDFMLDAPERHKGEAPHRQGCSTLWDAEKVEEVIDATDSSAEAVLGE